MRLLGADSGLAPVHSAAQGNEANLVDTTEDFYTRHFDANVKGPIFLTKAVEPYLPKGGRIVFISSAGARLGVAGQTVYAATKAADEALVRVWAKELGQSHGITVNCVNPGPIATGTHDKQGQYPWPRPVTERKYNADFSYHVFNRPMVPK